MFSNLRMKLKKAVRGEVPISELIEAGLKVGKNFSRQEEVKIDPSHCELITIGDNVILAPRVHILAHDASLKPFLGYTKLGRVTIGNNVFIGANSIVLPNVQIGDNVVIGAGSVVSKDVKSNSVVAGNPARFIKSIDNYLGENNKIIESTTIFDRKWKESNLTKTQRIRDMTEATKDGVAFMTSKRIN
ncbi:acyltransferase [Planomicrobium chinense]|nr:acyltransferase [Planococcus chinensis]